MNEIDTDYLLDTGENLDTLKDGSKDTETSFFDNSSNDNNSDGQNGAGKTKLEKLH